MSEPSLVDIWPTAVYPSTGLFRTLCPFCGRVSTYSLAATPRVKVEVSLLDHLLGHVEEMAEL